MSAGPEEGPPPKRLLLSLPLLLFLLLDLALGVWETGGWRTFVTVNLAVPDQASAWSVLPAAVCTYVGAFGTLTGMLWPVLFWGTVVSTFVVIRMFKVREDFLRRRLALAVVGYFVFTAGISYYALKGWNFPAVPNPGGTGQPAWTLYTGISVLVYVVLALLFGRVSYCGWFCPAAAFWSGIGQGFIRYNLDAAKGRRIRRVTMPAVLVLFLGTTVLSILDTFKVINFTFFGTDPAVFFSGLWWMVLWFILVVAVPFTGARFFSRFLCPVGALAGIIGRFGLARLEAVDKTACERCQTRACDLACEMSIMPHRVLAVRGVSRSVACVGCGNCLEACPQRNLHYYHFGAWLAERFRGNRVRWTPLSRQNFDLF
ncbi:MAG: 4Fe-4S binding protein [Peptococcaceae bacterium]|nr:4Fe-4S binding protein [Peptococcaceae bacterium]